MIDDKLSPTKTWLLWAVDGAPPQACEVVPSNLDRLTLSVTPGFGPTFDFDQHRTGVRRQYYSTLPQRAAWRWRRRIGGESGASMMVRATTHAQALESWKSNGGQVFDGMLR